MEARKLFLATGVVAAGGLLYAAYRWHRRRQEQHMKAINKIRNRRLQRKMIVVRTAEEWEAAYTHIKDDLTVCKVLGFDCEWVTRHKHVQPVALIQLATPGQTCVLVQVCHMEDMPDTLIELLADPSILKTGVACVEDAKKLENDYDLCVRGCVDLRNMAIRSRILRPGANKSLKALAKEVIGAHLDKGEKVRCSNWEAKNLRHDQVKYAALDAIVGVEIFLELVNIKHSWSPCFDTNQIGNNWFKVMSMCQGIVDIKYKSRQGYAAKSSTDSTQNGGKQLKNVKSKQISRAYSSRKQPLYHNCQLQAPDGQALCTCDLKKALWYIEKGLGKKVKDDPLVVQLTFEPSGRPMNEQNYYLQYKDNICVVCGKSDSYIRKNVVPHEYRKHFPGVMKDHLSHDVVLLCLACHQQASVCDSQLKQRLAAECDAPISNSKGGKYSQDVYLNQVRSAAKALYLNRETIPSWRVEELESLVHEHFGVTEITPDLLEDAMNMDPKKYNPGFVSHGEKVVRYMVEHEGLVALEKRWRSHFLETMQPQFLPALWSVDHNHERLSQVPS